MMGEPGKPGMSGKAGAMTRAGGSSTAGAVDDRLDRLLQTMNSTTGAEKTEAMAALLNVLVEQHRAMLAGEKGTGAPVMPGASSGSSPKP